jgi:hypothetical protein
LGAATLDENAGSPELATELIVFGLGVTLPSFHR